MVMEINREDERPDVVMTVQDKDDINKFSRHLARRNELKVRIQRRKKLIQLHEDASDELILMDDDADVHYTIGDVFIVDDKDQIEATLDATKAELNKDVEDYEDELKAIQEDMTKLKATLYAKFGKVRVATSVLQLVLDSVIFRMTRRTSLGSPPCLFSFVKLLTNRYLLLLVHFPVL